MQFNVSVTKSVGPASVTVTAPASVVVAGNSDAQFPVTLSVPASAGTGGTAFQDIGGYIQLTPSTSRLNGNVSLTVPYYLVTHGRSNVSATLGSGALNFTNAGSALATTTPGLWTWGLYQPMPQGVLQKDVRAVGTLLSGTNVFFALNTHDRISTTLAFQEVDICIDTSGGAGFTPNKILIGINQSALSSTGSATTLFNGTISDRRQLQHQRRWDDPVRHHAANRQLDRPVGGSQGGHDRQQRARPDGRQSALQVPGVVLRHRRHRSADAGHRLL